MRLGSILSFSILIFRRDRKGQMLDAINGYFGQIVKEAEAGDRQFSQLTENSVN
ncbi:MAG: hypothetical protein SW833_24325 [Cyanobacteriota bacterium]|nr:hypothetical protein [Cyanobacteriota bacterium]